MISSDECEFTISEQSERFPLLAKKAPHPQKVNHRFALEPTVLIFYFGMFIAETIVPNEILKLSCYEKLENHTECNLIGFDNDNNNDSEIRDSLQEDAAHVLVLTTIFSKVVPAIVTFFIMPWSDKYGRKTILVLSYFGSALSVLLMLLNSRGGRFSSSWNYAFAHIPNAFVGASATKSTVIFSYISDISSQAEKSSRLLAAEIVIAIGIFFGSIASGYLVKSTSAEIVFTTALICMLVSCFLCIVFVDDSLKATEEASISKFKLISKLFSLEPLADTKNTLLKKRKLRESRTLYYLIFIQMLVYSVQDGERSIFYLFTMTKFNWTLKDFSMFNSTLTLLVVTGHILGIFIFKRFFNFSDTSLLILSSVFRVIDSSFKSFATSTYQMYVISIMCLLRALLASMNRSILSSFIPHNEIGKVFTILSFSETFGGFAAPAIYTSVYLKSFNFYPGAFYIMSTCFEVTIFFSTLLVARMLSERKMVMALFVERNLDFRLYKKVAV